jgi:aspartyl-tRNA(Asn)/glutamyl-tRNA(Gln) amidotransferase subunit A
MAELGEDIFFATFGELGAKLRSGELSPKQLAHGFLGRVQKLGPRYNALAFSLRDWLHKELPKADDRIKNGHIRGPLEGIPCGIEDLLSFKKQPTTWGAGAFAHQVFDYNATAVEKLKKSGALPIAKLAAIELGGAGGYREAGASLFGPGLNPWDPTRWSGGSSSGPASAVAAGLVPFALGSETCGSMAVPCAYCGVTGLRPTYGLVSCYGAMPLAWTMDKIGPMCRSAVDCALVLNAVSGGDWDDPGSAGKRYYYWPKEYEAGLARLRVGVLTADFTERAEAGARPAFQAALEVIRATGVQVKEAQLPEFPYGAIADVILSAEASAVFQPHIESGRLNSLADPTQLAGLKAGLEITAADYLKAMRARRQIQDAFNKMFVDYDILAAPACYGAAPPISEPVNRGASPNLTAGANLAGLPALFLPCGFAGGLPVGIQLVSRSFAEGVVVAVGREFQNRTDWHRRRPNAQAPQSAS